MSSASLILVLSGVFCLVVSGVMMYKLIPREGRPAPAWMQSDTGETVLALGQFILMIAGLALVAKGIL